MKKTSLLVPGALALLLTTPAWSASFSKNAHPPTATTGQQPLAPEVLFTITQSTSLTPTVGSVSCNAGTPTFLHTDNSYYRGFTLSAFPALVEPQFVVQSVSIGVESANASGTGTTQPATVRIWAATANPISGAADPPGASTVSSEAINISDQTLSLLPVPLTTQPLFLVASGIVAVELFTPSGQAAGHSFFVGSNAGGQSGPSYIKAASCGLTTIGNLAGIGFANMHIVMTVTGNNQTPVELQQFSVD
ncbi:MAG: hypothetical protein ABI639_02000 [Thermoanaerobaculia bacterium]